MDAERNFTTRIEPQDQSPEALVQNSPEPQAPSQTKGRHRAIGRNEPVFCRSCHTVVERKTRHQIFCTPQCADRYFEKGRARSRKAEFAQTPSPRKFDRTDVLSRRLDRDTRAPGLSPEKVNDFRGLRRPTSGTLPPIFGPERIVRQEVVGGGPGEKVISSDGVIAYAYRRPAKAGAK